MRPGSLSKSSAAKVRTVLNPDGTITTTAAATSNNYNDIDNCATPSSCYSSEENDDPMIEEDDELHLIGDTNRPLLSTKALSFLLLNLIFICLAVTWLIRQQFTLDLFGTILITLSSWALVVNCVLVGRVFIRVREESLLAGRPDDFRDYVRRVATIAPSSNTITASTQPNNKSMFLNGTQPVFV